MLSLYFMLKISACIFSVLTFIFMFGVLFSKSTGPLLFLGISILCFMISAIALIVENAKCEKNAIVEILHLKNEDEIESMDSIGRSKTFYEVKTKEGSYHVVFKEGEPKPIISKVEKLEIKNLEKN
ncbi:hypothetical protein [Bacillus sp. NPDC094106]|uniref:hypothetical protein n=1 Tax=Bacillus sp. NPDC094106 TaxID=3363949 RepID=UPI0038097902